MWPGFHATGWALALILMGAALAFPASGDCEGGSEAPCAATGTWLLSRKVQGSTVRDITGLAGDLAGRSDRSWLAVQTETYMKGFQRILRSPTGIKHQFLSFKR